MRLRIWCQILSELAFQQDLSPKEFSGQVVNPICGAPYVLDTLCAIKAFAIEYHRTKDEQWFKRAMSAFESTPVQDIYSGLPEPTWNSLGWHEEAGSLAATGIALDALWDSMDILGLSLQENLFEALLHFLNGCFHGKGRFAHNTVDQRKRPPDVQNTTSVALYLLEYISQKISDTKHPLFRERVNAVRHLFRGQDRSGYWPYFYPGCREWIKTVFHSLANKEKQGSFLSRLSFGDTMHHVMTLYFLVKYTLLSKDRSCFNAISRGWDWISTHLVNNKGSLAIDWDWEPIPTYPRYCNFRDTNTYFWILGLLPRLYDLGTIHREQGIKIANGLINHIESNLLREEGKIPCIAPHEGPPQILRNILPMFDQGVAWKGCFLAEITKNYR